MPILAAEPDIFPCDLLDEPADSVGAPWWVLYTMSRREKQLMRQLLSAEVPFYAPLIKQQQRSPAGRRRVSYLPLFPGYVFLRGDDEQRREALASNCISRCLQVSDTPRLVADLQRIRRLLDSGLPLEREPRLQPGQQVRICFGSLAGLGGGGGIHLGQEGLVGGVEFFWEGGLNL